MEDLLSLYREIQISQSQSDFLLRIERYFFKRNTARLLSEATPGEHLLALEKAIGELSFTSQTSNDIHSMIQEGLSHIREMLENGDMIMAKNQKEIVIWMFPSEFQGIAKLVDDQLEDIFLKIRNLLKNALGSYYDTIPGKGDVVISILKWENN